MKVLLILAALVAAAYGCSDMSGRMSRIAGCQRDMASRAQTDPCGAYRSFLSCARAATAGCPALEAQLEQSIAAMRAQMGGMCDGNGPSPGGGNGPSPGGGNGPSPGGGSETESEESSEATAAPPGGNCRAELAMRRMQRCQAFMQKIQSKISNKRKFCRRVPKVITCLRKSIRGCPHLQAAVASVIQSTEGVISAICGPRPTTGS